MIKPGALVKGDVIGVVAPSGPTEREEVEIARIKLENLGFNVKLGDGCYSSYGYLAGRDDLRANDINKMFADDEVKGIICLRGGYGASRILNKIDYENIKKNPKVFIGYSDITALHIALNQMCRLVTFHGPMMTSDIVEGLDQFSRDEMIRAIMDPSIMGPLGNPEGIETHCLVKGEATGVIVGGNLSLVASLMGTPYEIDTRGKILFLEEIEEEPYRVDRMLTQLALGGKLDEAEGFILGDWNDCGPKNENSLSLMEVFKDIIVPYNKPTIYDLKAGHCTPKLTLPLGVKATLKANMGQIVIEEEATI